MFICLYLSCLYFQIPRVQQIEMPHKTGTTGCILMHVQAPPPLTHFPVTPSFGEVGAAAMRPPTPTHTFILCPSTTPALWRRFTVFSPLLLLPGNPSDGRSPSSTPSYSSFLLSAKLSHFKPTECSLNIVFFLRFWNIFQTMASLGFPSVWVSLHNGRSNTSAAAELAEFRKITTF